MNTEEKISAPRVALIAYKYPPYQGVGAYRWARLTKYLARMGVTIHVFTAWWPNSAVDHFSQDLKHPNLKIHRLPITYRARIFYWKPTHLLGRALRKILNVGLLKPFLLKYGENQAWDGVLKPYFAKVHEQVKFDILVATGGPFLNNVWAAQIKENYPDLKLIQDFRDFWALDKFAGYPKNLLKKITLLQDQCVAAADYVVSVSRDTLNGFISPNSEKGIVIFNGFDPELFPKTTTSTQKNLPLSFIYAGQFFSGREAILDQFLDIFKGDPELLKDFQLIIVGGLLSKKIEQKHADLMNMEKIVRYPLLPQSQVFDMFKLARYALQINADIPGAMSSKLFEYAYAKIPTVSLNYGGEIVDFINDVDMGVSINLKTDNLKAKIGELKGLDRTFTYKIQAYTAENTADQYLQLFRKALKNGHF